MAIASSSSSSSSIRSLHQTSLFPNYPSLHHISQFRPPPQLSATQFPFRIRASSAFALESDSNTKPQDIVEVDLFACPICYEPLIRKGPPGFNLPTIYRSGFRCSKCKKSYTSKNTYLDLTVTAGTKAYTEFKPAGTELFRSPLVSFLYERGWRQNFNRRGFPGPDEEVNRTFFILCLQFKMAQELFKPTEGGVLVDVSCGSGLFAGNLPNPGPI